MKKIILALALIASGLAMHSAKAENFAYRDHGGGYGYGNDYVYCAIGDYRWACQEAANGNPRFVAEGCLGSYGETATPALTPQNIYHVGLRYGYQQRPRRPYNNAGQPVWYFTADSYDWACTYTAIHMYR